jgi:DNA-directed RNA polymerase specialized sigma24 family protein
MRYLLAAEADKIQEFIFRSSRLREVVGASQLLTRFCRSVEDTLTKEYNAQVVVNDGGSFRVIFGTREQAVAFGADLAELYRLALGGSLTVAEPVTLNGDFREANDRAGKALRWAKSRRQGVIAEPHMPYVAFCASCGVALAQGHTKLAKERDDDRERYLCGDCLRKAEESATNRADLLNEFLADVIEDSSQLSSFEFLFEPEKVGRYDPRNYVAYLVADGNGMGRLFGRLQHEDALHQFSTELSSAVRKSLAAATRKLRDQTGKLSKADVWSIPVLPLILGGDDLFALIPAPYALDFARRFCLEWEAQMDKLVKEVGLTDVPRPTVAAAVVICKSKYPYALAHRRAKELLKEAKRHCKLLAAERGEHLSAVNFEVILGNRLAGLEEEDEQVNGDVKLTLRPYWVTNNGLPASAEERGIELKQLLDQRRSLKNLPNKRLAELRRCFEDLPSDMAVRNRHQELEDWTTRKLSRILQRLVSSSRAHVEAALQSLGKPKDKGSGRHHWREIPGRNGTLLAHGMLDLLEAWDFAQDLGHSPDKYEPQEEEA